MNQQTMLDHDFALTAPTRTPRPECPFCQSHDLRVVDWMDDDGEYDAVECNRCHGAAPLHVWDARR